MANLRERNGLDAKFETALELFDATLLEQAGKLHPVEGDPIEGREAIVSQRVIVRVWFSHDRAQEAERELADLAGQRPYRQGTSCELLWDFSNLEQAQMFKVQADNTPGVKRIEIS